MARAFSTDISSGCAASAAAGAGERTAAARAPGVRDGHLSACHLSLRGFQVEYVPVPKRFRVDILPKSRVSFSGQMSTRDTEDRLELLQGTLDLLILRTLIFGSAARPGHRARHPADVGRRAAGRARSALSRAAAARGARLDFREVGRLQEQSQGPLLFADGGRPQTTREGNQRSGSGWRRRSGAFSVPRRVSSVSIRRGSTMFRRKRTASDFGAEIEAHLELETERLQEQGLARRRHEPPRVARSATSRARKSASTNPAAGSGGTTSGRTFATPCACCASLPASPPSRS